MTILVVNSGSSSVKAALFSDDTEERLLTVGIGGIGEPQGLLRINGDTSEMTVDSHNEAFALLFEMLNDYGKGMNTVTAVGHRVLHGGETMRAPTVVTDAVEIAISSMNPLAPLHNPVCLAGIRAARAALPECPHVAVFDTAFHATLPTRSRIYALPEEVTRKHSLRRFGFHGISHENVSQAAADALRTPLAQLRIISCHLGNGCSVTAVENGRSVDTSMGMTPLEGLVMGSRSGNIDPGIPIKLSRDAKYSADDLDTLLNRQSGLYGMTGSNDMREIESRAAAGDDSCRRAIQVFCHRARKYVGAFAAVMGGADVIVFTGGIGEGSAVVRHRIAQRLEFMGARLDEDKNRDAIPSSTQPVVDISDDCSRVKIFVIASDEEVAIARAVATTLRAGLDTESFPPIPIAVSARHVHLDQATVEALFGAGHSLTPARDLSQPAQYAAQETVTLVGPRNRIESVRVLGPTRQGNQVEISRSDEFFLGIDAPVRASGDTANTPGITLIGSAGTVTLRNGVICALRHIHMHPRDAQRFHVKDGDSVEVAIDSDDRDLTFGDVLIRVSDRFRLEMHIDTDEANASGLHPHDSGSLMAIEGQARIVGDRKI